MDSSAAWKKPNIRSTNALTANSANGVLICGAADVLTKADTPGSPAKKPNLISPFLAVGATSLKWFEKPSARSQAEGFS
jgi:hypothetical protein